MELRVPRTLSMFSTIRLHSQVPLRCSVFHGSAFQDPLSIFSKTLPFLYGKDIYWCCHLFVHPSCPAASYQEKSIQKYFFVQTSVNVNGGRGLCTHVQRSPFEKWEPPSETVEHCCKEYQLSLKRFAPISGPPALQAIRIWPCSVLDLALFLACFCRSTFSLSNIGS